MARLRVERSIAADPTSTALLLAGPAALELWPGLRRTPDLVLADGVAVDVPTWSARRPARVTVRARAPRRTPTAYVTRFEFAGPGVPTTTGVLTLTYEPHGEHAVATSALLRLDFSPLESGGRLLDRVRTGRAMREMAEGFLANLAAAAESRATAA